MKILHSLATVMTRCAKPWRPPSHHTFSMARAMFMDDMTGPVFFGPSIFVDAAWDSFGYRVGGVVPKRGVRSWAVQNRVFNRSSREWRGLSAWRAVSGGGR